MKEKIRERAKELGFDACQFTTSVAPTSADRLRDWLHQSRHGEMQYLERNASKRSDPQLVLRGVKSVICLAVNYHDPASDGPATPQTGFSGVIARYARTTDYHSVLGERLRLLADFLDRTFVGSRSLWYVDTGPILERDFAQRAGIGFIGKHTNVISREFGNWILLAEILTTAEFEPDPPETNRCGHCTRCIVACPTRAITGPFQLDARLCISYLTIELKGSIPVELRPLIGARIFGCDDCLAACPWNRFAQSGRIMKCRRDLRAVDLIELLALDDARFRARFRGTPMLRSKRRGLLRNACVALGNIGDLSALPALHKATGDSEPLIADHAKWAIHQIENRCSGQKACENCR